MTKQTQESNQTHHNVIFFSNASIIAAAFAATSLHS